MVTCSMACAKLMFCCCGQGRRRIFVLQAGDAILVDGLEGLRRRRPPFCAARPGCLGFFFQVGGPALFGHLLVFHFLWWLALVARPRRAAGPRSVAPPGV